MVRPDLIMMDLELPRIDGLELLRELRSRPFYRDVPVVVFTGSQRPEDLSRSYHLGANCVVYKPVRTEDYVAVVRSVEHYWLDVVAGPAAHPWAAAS
jgi:CheY-like chemotaxis protein